MQTDKGNTARLPAELDYLVIDHLADDQASLFACSLVCHRWLRAAHSHLFRSVEVASTARDSRFAAFADFLKTSPGVCEHIRDLALSCEPACGVEEKRRPEEVSVLRVREMLTMLPHLERLTMTGVRIRTAPATLDLAMPVVSRPRLRSLRITGCRFHDDCMSPTLQVLNIFAAVDELTYGGFWDIETARPPPIAQPSTTEVRHLHFDMLGARSTKMLSDFLRSSANFRDALESVHLTWFDWTEVQESGRFLADVGPQLKRLELEPIDQFWERSTSDDSQWCSFVLANCTKLESLRLHLNYSYLSYQTDGHKCFFTAVTAYTQILARHPPPRLRNLTLKVPFFLRRGGVDVTHNATLWRSMDAAIASLPSFKSMTLEVCSLSSLPKENEDALTRTFRRVLSQIDARGVLRIVFKGDLVLDEFDYPPDLASLTYPFGA
ncbi:hypothetical protein BV20DRAFT_1055623 [Pilatotrama ljubarskyi]|nr:hypothetical protein BV20DRAFT_1055623 [Pilatotrama ljubarskyi]